MPRSYQPIEFNTFIGGLVTEASPLTFPNNASLDEENFVLNKNGSRSRRLGMAFEENYVEVSSDQSLVDGKLTTSSFKWSNAGGLSTNTVICVQIGASIDFFKASGDSISPNKIYTHTFKDIKDVGRFSYATVDGLLVVTTGSKDVTIFKYDTTVTTNPISVSTTRLLVRDFFGLDAIDTNGKNLRQSNYVATRPLVSEAPDSHIYNLRNQGWGIPYPRWYDDDVREDVIVSFVNAYNNGHFPANADNITAYLIANTTAGKHANLTLTRYNAENHYQNGPSTTYGPIGSFIIDVLDRGTSRQQALRNLQSDYPANSQEYFDRAIDALAKLPDTTPSGATCVCEYAGRAWFGGFSGEVVGGDTHSPKLSSYLMFSQLVKDPSNIGLCYQNADPTDHTDSDLVDTDGGFLRIEGAYNIVGMVVLVNNLFVFAENGVWNISGGSASGFTATNYQVSQLTNAGCIGAGSIVTMQDSIFYWSQDGIYSITRNQFGDFSSSNITDKTIKSFFMKISNEAMRAAEGVYDPYTSTVKWLFNNYIGAEDDVIELNLDITTGAYYKHRLKALSGGFPLPVRGIQTDPYRIDSVENDVVVSSGDVVETVDGSDVVVDETEVVDGVKDIVYFIITGAS